MTKDQWDAWREKMRRAQAAHQARKDAERNAIETTAQAIRELDEQFPHLRGVRMRTRESDIR